jgi:cell division protein FtsI (penicillin-binding protein 3)
VTGRAERVRIGMTVAGFGLAFVALGMRASQLTLLDGQSLRDRARRQHTRMLELQPRRGPIVDRAGEALGLTRESVDVYVRPREADATDAQIAQLAGVLELPGEVVAARVRSTQPFVYLKRRVSPARWAKVVGLEIAGVDREQTRERVYPRGPLAGHVVGFTSIDGDGLEGIERRFDRELRGESNALRVERDAWGRLLVLGGDEWGPLPRVGARVELTIDAGIQHVAEIELEKAVAQYAASAGSAIVIDPRSGEILAMANVPRFDPNRFRFSRPTDWRNRAITDMYEPGSTFKAILAAAALSEGVVAPDELIDCEGGRFRIGRRTIHDHHRYEVLSFADVIANSSNIGCAKVAGRLGAERLHEAISHFGFARKTGIALPGEVRGLIRSPQSWQPIDLATASFGQGVAVSPLQLVGAFAGIANAGEMMRPFIVRRVVDERGAVILERRPTLVGRVVEAGVAQTLTEILVRVVEDGTGTQAEIDGYAVAGKTGTSQKVDAETGRYHQTDRIASFVGYVPARDPALAIVVVVDTPTAGSTYGGVVAAPVFRRIAEYALGRVGVVPDRDPMLEQQQPVPPDGLVPVAFRPAAEEEPVGDLTGLPGTPSFLGLGMRAALVMAHQRGWPVRIEGAGYVVGQDPRPGAAEPDGELTLTFAMDG